MRFRSLRAPIWLQKSRPKLIHDALEAQGPPRSAPGSLRNHKRHAMEPKLSPGPSRSTRWLPQGFHKGAPDTHRTPKMESQITPELPKWSLAQGFQNDTEINQNSNQTDQKFKTKLNPTWNHSNQILIHYYAQPSAKRDVTTRQTQKKGGGGVSP